MTEATIPELVLRAYGFADAHIEPLAGGLINRTYLVRVAGQPRAVVQRLHPIFGPRVNLDLDAITSHLHALGMVTPRLVRTRDDALWVEHEGHTFRALSHVAGTTLHRVPDARAAHAAGALVGRFHRALEHFQHDYAFTRAGVHDTASHLARLERALSGPGDAASVDAGPDSDPSWLEPARRLGHEILAQAHVLPALGALPARHTHGDLKISNILFAPGDTSQAICLLDLDTLGRQSLAYELGDALRSWCNPAGEDVGRVAVAQDILAAAMAGYRSSVGDMLEPAEWAAIIPGLETICVELAARFCVDVFEDAYFGWDPGRFASRRAHNLVRATGQLALARSVREQRDQRLALAVPGGPG